MNSFKRMTSMFTVLAVLSAATSCGSNVGGGSADNNAPVSTESTTAAQEAAAPAVTEAAADPAASTDTATLVSGTVTETTAVTTVASTETTSSVTPEFTLDSYDITVSVGGTKTPILSVQGLQEVWTTSNENVAVVDEYGHITGKSEGNCVVTISLKDKPEQKAEVKVTVVAADDGLTYIQGMLIANKTYSLPADYNPGGLTPETQAAFNNLVQGAANDGINIYLSSGFRSYEYQSQIYNNYCSIYGQSTADTFSARPGHSEHQTGMAIDVNIIDDSFIGTPEALWIEAHCNEYGFILRYPQGKQEITGYKYEPWHIRYVGIENAQKIREKANEVGDPYLTLEEYLKIDSVYQN